MTDLPPLPEWSKRDDLGGLVPSEIRTALKDYARAAVEAEREACAQECDAQASIEGIAQKCAAAIRARGGNG
jgi:hypothetical protein